MIQSGSPDHQSRLVRLLLMPISVVVAIFGFGLFLVIRRLRHRQAMQSGTTTPAAAATSQRQRLVVRRRSDTRMLLMLARTSPQSRPSVGAGRAPRATGRAWSFQHNGRHLSQSIRNKQPKFRGRSPRHNSAREWVQAQYENYQGANFLRQLLLRHGPQFVWLLS